MGVYDFTSGYEEMNPVSFHMPGHKGSDLYSRFGFDLWLRNFPDRDITEITGADNLFQPEGIISDTMDKYRSLYDTKATYLLINGSSAGIIASIMTCVEPGGKLIMARNCHKAVFNALRLGGVKPVYVYPEMIPGYGVAGQVKAEDVAFAIRENPDARAVILPSPNYYGICSDIEAIAELAHEAGMKLIVDQAHGAHLKLFEKAHNVVEKAILEGANIADGSGDDGQGARAGHTHMPDMPKSAESAGADLVINSTHKTLGSLTQSAILNVCTDSVDLFDLEDRLQMIQSTSPSYILMESLDINADIIREHADQLMEEWHDNLLDFYRDVKYIPGLRIMKSEGLDPTKINLDMSRIGLDGAALDEELMERSIFAELATGNILMCMTGIGNSSGDYERLKDALKEISWKFGKDLIEAMKDSGDTLAWREGMEGFDEEEYESEDKSNQPGTGVDDHKPPENREDPYEAESESRGGSASVWASKRHMGDIPVKKKLIPLDEAAGLICATALIPYPPGIPLICPGEEIGMEDIEYIRELREAGEKVIGVDPEGRIAVGSE